MRYRLLSLADPAVWCWWLTLYSPTCDLLQREIRCPELRCCYPSLKWEAPSLKAPLETFMSFLQGLRNDKVHTSGRRLEPPEKVLHLFPLMVCTILLPVTSNFWSLFKLKGWEGRSWAGMSSILHMWLLEESRFCCLLRLNSEALICDQRAPESSQRALNCLMWCCRSIWFQLTTLLLNAEEHIGCCCLCPFVCEAELP